MAHDANPKRPSPAEIEENARFAAELRAELAEEDALWAKYPHEMSMLEAAEDALYHAPARGLGRKRAEERLAQAREALAAVKKGEGR